MSTEALKKFVLRHHFDDVITALGTAIDLKSDKNLTDQLTQRVNVRIRVYYKYIHVFTIIPIMYTLYSYAHMHILIAVHTYNIHSNIFTYVYSY